MYTATSDRYEKMDFSRCGKSGLLLPKVSIGFWQNFGSKADSQNMKDICFTAFDEGITHFDLANNYGPIPGSAEINVGKILNEEMKVYRDEMIISTKAGYTMWDGPYGDWGSRKYILASLDQSLQRMGVDYVDIFYHHRMDPQTPLEESMMALDQAVKSGKALYAGISNYDTATTQKAMEILRDLKCPFIINQIRYSIFDRHIEEDHLPDFAVENGCGLIAFSPLAQGLLTDRYLGGIPSDSRINANSPSINSSALTQERLDQIKALNEVAQNRGQTLAQMALSWVLKDNKVTSVLIGASKPSQVLDNVQSIKKCEFTEEELKIIDKISLA